MIFYFENDTKVTLSPQLTVKVIEENIPCVQKSLIHNLTYKRMQLRKRALGQVYTN